MCFEYANHPLFRGCKLFSLLFCTAMAVYPQASGDAGGVHGSVYTPVMQDHLVGSFDGANPSAYKLYVPQFQVTLVNATTNTTVATTQTDLFGRYMFHYQPAGFYRVCWNNPGWNPGCAPDKIVVKNDIFGVNPTAVTPQLSVVAAGRGAFWGRVRLTDGSSPYFSEPHFQILSTASITVLNLSGQLVGKTVTNVSGEYVVVNLPPASVRASAQTEGARTTSIVSSSTVGGGGAAHLTLPNSRPLLDSLASRKAGKGVREANAGDILDLTSEARDNDGDPIRYTWKAAPGAGQIASTAGSNATWQLENASGKQTMYLVISDDRGGYTTRSVTVTVGIGLVGFSGKVSTQLGVPIPDPTVEINSVKFKGKSDGSFYARVKRSSRYVVNVSATGYMPASKVFDQGGLFNEYRLLKANVVRFDPKQTVTLVGTRDPKTGAGDRVRPATILMPGGTLVAAGNLPPTGAVTSYVATVDPANAEMPGDYGALQGGVQTNLISYGAVWAEFYDDAGNKLNIGTGKSAQITVAPPFQLSPPPPSIQLWSYNESTGYWDDALRTAEYDANRGAYVGKVSHFSTYNTDIAKSNASCVRILLDNIDRNNLKARVSYVAGGTPFVQTPEQILGDSLNAFYRLPANTDVRVTVLDAVTNANVATAKLLDLNQQPLAGNVVNTGPPNPDFWPPVPYDGCVTTSIRLDLPSGSISRIPFLTFFGEGTQNGAIGYYTKLDPGLTWNGGTLTYSGGTRSTLGAWWTQAGFNATTGAGGTRAAYMNFGDLGFGRDMHIRQSGSNVYAYVTNYGKPDQNPLNADLANTADKNVSAATVAMEFSPMTGVTGNVVKFFVYSSGKPDGKLINSANLDGFGEKFVPNLCTTCHGGNPYYPANELAPTTLEASLRPSLSPGVVGASFREFDTDALRYPGGLTALPAAARPAFHALNQLVKQTSPQVGINELIDGYYAGLAAPSTDPPNTSFFPPAWGATPDKVQLYQQVVAKSCRTCHIAFNNTSINWTTYSQFQARRGSIQSFVCGSPGVAPGTNDKFMPHALMTYRNFWLSTGPSRPTLLGAFSAADWAAFGSCQ